MVSVRTLNLALELKGEPCVAPDTEEKHDYTEDAGILYGLNH